MAPLGSHQLLHPPTIQTEGDEEQNLEKGKFSLLLNE